MSGISSISGLFPLSYRPMNSVMQELEALDDIEDDGELVIETEGDVETEEVSEEGDGSHDGEEDSPLGNEIDAWG